MQLAVLSPDDATRYRQIFDDERSGKFADADALAAQLSDKSLMGYVEAEHYLSPTSTASESELIGWMSQYGDTGMAPRIYALAVRRASVPVRKHHRVVAVRVTANVPSPSAMPRLPGGGYEDYDFTGSDVSAGARATQAQIETAIRADQPAQADAALQALAASGSAYQSDVAKLSQRVAQSYIAEGKDFEAFDVTSRVSGFNRDSAPMLDWWGGLAAYRMGKFDIAAQHFEKLSKQGSVVNWTRAQAAFWAARAYLANGQDEYVIPLLQAAAKEQPTFYGLLAEQALGQDTQTGFRDPAVDPAALARLMQNPAAHRALAAYQVGYTEPLRVEMARALATMDYNSSETYAACARAMDLPDLELRASEMAASKGEKLTGLFPVPRYQPPGGYHIDPSLVLAFVRIESKFQAKAVSGAGARGLMQVMPQTARLIDGDSSASAMTDPSYSLGLGQTYLSQLLDQMNGNLYNVAASYNAGPGAVWKWMDAKRHDDALLYIESIPVSETRNYIKKLMTYYWLYSRRNNEPTATLTQAAAGDWPKYKREMPTATPAPQPPPAQAAPPAQAQPATTIVSDAALH
ncbi:MAG TPA: lytic transglycosylase domain-containing protein [Rhizomicrobium sp.]|nr:lytic transglycosylase domain-containing protein [Rhizomicrobium sp.]